MYMYIQVIDTLYTCILYGHKDKLAKGWEMEQNNFIKFNKNTILIFTLNIKY